MIQTKSFCIIFNVILIFLSIFALKLTDFIIISDFKVSIVSLLAILQQISAKAGYHKEIPEDSIIDIRKIKWANDPMNTEHTLYIQDNFSFKSWGGKHQKISNINNNNLFHLRNCYVSGNGAIFYKNKFILGSGIPGKIRYLYQPLNGSVIGTRDLVISIGHYYSTIYGHFIQDSLSPLMEVPSDILQQSTVTICTHAKLINEFFPTLNISKEVQHLSPSQWLFAKELYININPRPHMNHLGPCFRKLTLLIRERFNLTRIVPYRYIISQRKTRNRFIGNFDKLFNAVNTTYPDFPWEKDYQTPRPLNETVKFWSNAKIFYAVAGSNYFNCVFFPQSVVAIIVFSNVYDISALGAITSNNFRTVLYQEPSMKHFSAMKNNFNITRALLAFKIALYVQNSHTWPNEPNTALLR